METSKMEQKWIKINQRMVYQSRNSQRDVDQVAEGGAIQLSLAIQPILGCSQNVEIDENAI